MVNKATSMGNEKAAEHSLLLFLIAGKKGMKTLVGNRRKKSASLLFKLLFIVLGLLLFTIVAFGQGTFTSNSATGNWNISTNWTFSGDADGIPDGDDNVTILP